MNLRLPNSLHRRLREYAGRDDVSLNQFVVSAVAEKMAALDAERYLTEMAEGANRESYLAILAQVPDVEPADNDKVDSEPNSKISNH